MPHTTTLSKVGGSIMLAIPPALLDVTKLAAGKLVSVSIEGDRLIVESHHRRHYTLSELLAQCDNPAPFPTADDEWLATGPVGKELI